MRLLVLLSIVFLTSCVSSKKIEILHNQDVNEVVKTPEYIYRLQSEDELQISLYDAKEVRVSMLQNEQQTLNSSAASDSRLYQITDSGVVVLPSVGSVSLKGKTLEQARTLVFEKAKEVFADPIVSIKLVSFNVTTVGEFIAPGVFPISYDRLNLMQVISISGGFTPYANIKEVKIMRKTKEGIKSIVLDLTEPDFMMGEFFNIYPDDIVYVKPNVAKKYSSDVVPWVLSALSTLVVLANILTVRS